MVELLICRMLSTSIFTAHLDAFRHQPGGQIYLGVVLQAHVRCSDVDAPNCHIVLIVFVISASADRVPIDDQVARDVELNCTLVHFI